MQYDTLRKFTGWLSVGFGIYCLAVAALVIAFEAVAFFMIFALVFIFMGILYIIAGVSLLRNGRLGFIAFVGFFGSTFWWGHGIPYYYWPMMMMPIVILVLSVLVFLKNIQLMQD